MYLSYLLVLIGIAFCFGWVLGYKNLKLLGIVFMIAPFLCIYVYDIFYYDIHGYRGGGAPMHAVIYVTAALPLSIFVLLGYIFANKKRKSPK